MSVGNYFIYSSDSSTDAKFIFRYRLLQNKGEVNYSDKLPVYLSLEQNQVYCGFSTFMPYKSTWVNPGFAPGSKRRVSAEIFSLPLTPYDRNVDPLSVLLREKIFIPVNLESQFSQVAWEDLVLPPSVKHKFNVPTVAPVQNKRREDTAVNKQVGKTPVPENRPGSVLSPEVIFLDFLYDLYHSTVFDQVKDIDVIRSKMSEHYLCRSILCKENFMHSRQEMTGCKSWIENEKIHDGSAAVPEIYREKYWEAETKWIECLSDSKGYFLFEVHKWFRPSVREARDIAFLKDRDERSVSSLHHNGPPENSYGEVQNRNDTNMIDFLLERFNFFSAFRIFARHHTWKLALVAAAFIALLLVIPIPVIGTAALSALSVAACLKAIITVLAVASCFFFVIIPLVLWFIEFLWPGVKAKFNKDRPPDDQKAKVASFKLFFPYMAFGIVSAWLTYIPISQDAWMLTLHLKDIYFWLYVFFCGFTIFLIHVTVKYNIPEFKTNAYHILNSAYTFLAGISFSLLLGLLVMQLSIKEYIYASSQFFIPQDHHSLPVNESLGKYYRAKGIIDSFENMVYHQPDTARLSRIKKQSLQGLSDYFASSLRASDGHKELEARRNREIKRLQHELSRDLPAGHYKKNFFRPLESLLEDYHRKKIEEDMVTLTGKLEKDFYVPNIDSLKIGSWILFYNPRLLLLYSLIAFYLGYLFQVFIDFKNRKF